MTKLLKIASATVLCLCAVVASGNNQTPAPPSGSNQCGGDINDAKAHYAKLNLNKVNPASELPATAGDCVAEVNVGTAIDVACNIPANARYTIKLQEKLGYDGDQGFAWKDCSTAPNFLCPGNEVSWWGLGVANAEPGRIVIQARVVPMRPNILNTRARIVVAYSVPN
jgi:hypothetical protein